ncbi:hypothetical protein MHZ93_00530 [Roseomonas sp. ACRSG]|nr:hypothetical protein [Roseomonas sp. ACRSG]
MALPGLHYANSPDVETSEPYFQLASAVIVVGLAVVMVSVGVAETIGIRHAERRWSDLFNRVARRAPSVSAAPILVIGLYIG